MLAIFIGCSEDESASLTISTNNLNFSAGGGEQIVDISSDGVWECNYTEDWILVRYLQNGIKIIVDANMVETERVAVIKVLCNGDVRNQINITQEGVALNVQSLNFEVQYDGGELSIPIESNSEWDAVNTCEWIEIQKENPYLKVSISRNYQMQERSGEITLSVGELSKTIVVKQTASPWYESFEMIDVESGAFYMGAQKESSSKENYDENAYMIEAPVHSVTMSNFAIGKFEVTQAQWVAAMGHNPSSIQGDNLPVENVTWEQVQEFITLLNENSGKEYRLPTEAEWEYAARGGNKSEGYKYSGFSVLSACGWYYSNSESSTHKVGTKYPNELGIYDMSGNVREWCNDWFDYYTSSDANNPTGPDNGNMKVNRGGSWTTPAVNCRNSYRHTDFPHEGSQDLGFRLAISVKQ